MNKVRQAIIPDAGVSSRFLPIVKTIPKGLIPIGNKPAMQIQIEECIEAGVERIVIVCRKDTLDMYNDYFFNKREDLEKFLGEMGKSERFEPVKDIFKLPEIVFALQDEDLPYGTAAPIYSAKSALFENEPFFAFYGDDLVFGQQKDCITLKNAYEADPSASVYMICQDIGNDDVSRYGVIKYKEGTTDELDYIVEKPKKEDAPSRSISYGRFLYTWDIWNYMDPKNTGLDGEFWAVDAITALAKEKKVKVVETKAKWLTNGDPKRWLIAQMIFAVNNPEYCEDIKAEMRKLLENN